VGEALAPEVESLDENTIHHILLSKHDWEEVVEDPNDWSQVSKIVSKVMENGDESYYGKPDVLQKNLQIGNESVGVTYRIIDGKTTISDAWVNIKK
jgi:NDP-sugar pyrophosphorylase family protein